LRQLPQEWNQLEAGNTFQLDLWHRQTNKHTTMTVSQSHYKFSDIHPWQKGAIAFYIIEIRV
jgi:hypothetical protein